MHNQPKKNKNNLDNTEKEKKRIKHIMQNRSRKAQHEYFNTTRKGINIVCESLSDKRINLEIGILVA